MKRMLMLSLLFLLPTLLHAESEYNQWRINSAGVLSVITQTEKNEPVFISIAAGGTPGANVVITLMQDLSCDEQQISATLWINDKLQSVSYRCEHVHNIYLITYIIVDHKKANELYSELKSGFTVVLDKRIKIWVANINHPKYSL